MNGHAIVGWDIGGAHVKAALLHGGRLHDAAQWPCRLWQGLPQLEQALGAAARRWPGLRSHTHAVTMTGEMVDLFEHREQGVERIAALMNESLDEPRFFAGDAGWCSAGAAGARWRDIASANWLASARHVALELADHEGLLVDIGSTTTDLVAFRHGRVPSTSRRDADRLASGELVYQGVVRTPLCAIAQRVPWCGKPLNVMNEFFATTADVYRLTGELDPSHDQHPAADGGAKDRVATQARLARMIGLDAGDGDDAQWLQFARAWRDAQRVTLRAQLTRVVATHGLGSGALVVAAGCGAFLVPELIPDGWRCLSYAQHVARFDDGATEAALAWAGVGAPAVAVAALFQRETR